MKSFDLTPSSKVSTSGNFNVLNFSIDSLDEFYLINEDIVGNISYGEGIEFVGLELVNGTSSKNIDYNTTGIGSFIIDSSQISTPGIYGLVATANYNDSEINISSEFSVGSIDVSFADIEIDLGENVEIKLVINSGGFDNVNGYYFISVGDKPVGNSINSGFNVDEYINVGDFTPDKSGEIQITNALKGLLKRQAIYGYVFEGRNYLRFGAARKMIDLDMGDVAVKHLRQDGCDVYLLAGYLEILRGILPFVQYAESDHSARFSPHLQHSLDHTYAFRCLAVDLQYLVPGQHPLLISGGAGYGGNYCKLVFSAHGYFDPYTSKRSLQIVLAQLVVSGIEIGGIRIIEGLDHAVYRSLAQFVQIQVITVHVIIEDHLPRFFNKVEFTLSGGSAKPR